MAARMTKTRYPGIYQRHRAACRRKRDCECPYQAAVYSKREGKLLRKQFPALAEARTWREDASGAVRAGTLRSPATKTSAKPATS
jgi:hypothetical protein